MMIKKVVFVSIVILLGLATAALAEEPTDTLKKNIDDFIGVLKDPLYKDSAKEKEQTDNIWDIIERLFFFEGVARLALGKDWDKFSEPEKKEFTDSFTRLLGNSYLKKIREGYTNETVQFLDQEVRDDKKGVVRTKIVRQSGDIPVDYSLLVVQGVWRVYDVKIEGASLVKNYRAQFNQILMNNTPAQLIERVKKKVEEQEKGTEGKDDNV
ncbi:MAG: ABC transporter substrate-binding protein [Thermodesulfobacteriota bacterium]